jgi:hypothetical protein
MACSVCVVFGVFLVQRYINIAHELKFSVFRFDAGLRGLVRMRN